VSVSKSISAELPVFVVGKSVTTLATSGGDTDVEPHPASTTIRQNAKNVDNIFFMRSPFYTAFIITHFSVSVNQKMVWT
jgi:hypothetical protein